VLIPKRVPQLVNPQQPPPRIIAIEVAIQKGRASGNRAVGHRRPLTVPDRVRGVRDADIPSDDNAPGAQHVDLAAGSRSLYRDRLEGRIGVSREQSEPFGELRDEQRGLGIGQLFRSRLVGFGAARPITHHGRQDHEGRPRGPALQPSVGRPGHLVERDQVEA
jgi:hypothetical protein